jgi:hypothetical protein
MNEHCYVWHSGKLAWHHTFFYEGEASSLLNEKLLVVTHLILLVGRHLLYVKPSLLCVTRLKSCAAPQLGCSLDSVMRGSLNFL